MTVVGFTGTQLGMTFEQDTALNGFLLNIALTGAVHGGCIGADARFHEVMIQLGVPVEIRPGHDKWHNQPKTVIPDNAFKVYASEPYLDRNRKIVDQSTMMLATPADEVEQMRSGTWYTIRYARRMCKPLWIIYPSGVVVPA